MLRKIFIFTVWLLQFAYCDRGQKYNATHNVDGQKSYDDEEEGKVLPYRTWLTTTEIVLICVFSVLFLVLLVLCVIYVCCFGWRCPDCCTKCCHKGRKDVDYTQVRLHRERKIGEIWRTNY